MEFQTRSVQAMKRCGMLLRIIVIHVTSPQRNTMVFPGSILEHLPTLLNQSNHRIPQLRLLRATQSSHPHLLHVRRISRNHPKNLFDHSTDTAMLSAMSKASKPAHQSTNREQNDHVIPEAMIGEEVRLHIIISAVFIFFMVILDGDWVAAIAAIVATNLFTAVVRAIGYYKNRVSTTFSQGAAGAAQVSEQLHHGQLQQQAEPDNTEIKVEDADDDFSCLQ